MTKGEEACHQGVDLASKRNTSPVTETTTVREPNRPKHETARVAKPARATPHRRVGQGKVAEEDTIVLRLVDLPGKLTTRPGIDMSSYLPMVSRKHVSPRWTTRLL